MVATPPIERRPWTPGAIAALTLACVLWSAASVAAKIALGDGGARPGKLDPFVLAAIRFLGGGGVLWATARLRGEWVGVSRKDRLRFVVLGVMGIAVTYALFYGGLVHTTATDTTLLVAAEPVLIALIARVVLREAMGGLRMAGMAAGLAGVWLIVMKGLVPRFEGTVAANMVVTAALLFEAMSSIIGKQLSRAYPALMIAALGMLVGGAALLPFAVYRAAGRVMAMPGWPEIAAVAYLTLVCSALCYGIWYTLLRRYTVSSMAGFLFIQPVMGPILGYVMLGERLGLSSLAGGLLVVLGVSLILLSEGRQDGQVPVQERQA